MKEGQYVIHYLKILEGKREATIISNLQINNDYIISHNKIISEHLLEDVTSENIRVRVNP